MTGLLRRIVLAVFGGILGSLLAALLDARYAVTNAALSPQPFGELFLASAGLLVPIGWLVGGAVGVGLVALDPRRAWSPLALAALLRGGDARQRGSRAGTALLVSIAAILWSVVVANGARAALASGDPARHVGASTGLFAVFVALALALLVARLGPALGGALARSGGALSDPVITGGVGLAIAAAILAWGISAGTVGGTGGGFLGIFGVLKRDELDLRAPGLLVVVAASAALLPSAPKRFFAPLALALAVAPVVLTVRAAHALDASTGLATAIERSAPLAKIALRPLRRATDHDKDGFSRTFGGGDCNDRDARVNPAAVDEPGNGVDEDCSGSDAPAIAPPPAEPVAKVEAKEKEKAPEGLSILLVTVDTLRGDLGFAGYPKPVSPNLDALAAKSVVFDDAVSLASYTGKSVGPLMSGKYPSETHRGWSHFNSFTKDDVMIAERLRAAGFKTLSVQAHWYFERFSGLGRGFDVLDTSAMPPPGMQQDNDATTTSDKLTDAAIKRLGDPEITGSRFFAWVHYLDPHADYLHHDSVPDFGRDIRAPYDNEVAFTDQQIGRLLAFVAEQPWSKKLAIVVTSDHGEAFGEHKLLRHGFELWEELVRVPLIVNVPGVPPHHVKVRRSAIDVVPTLLDLANVTPALGTTPTDFLSGQSLLPDILDGPGWKPEERDVLVDMPAGPNNDERRAFYHGDMVLYVIGGYAYQLFDLATDPGEKTDLSEDKEKLADMRARYDAFRAKLREVKVKPIPK